MMQGLSSRFRSKLFNGALLIFSIRPQVSQLLQARLTDDLLLRKALATWPNKYRWFKEGYHHKNTDFESYLSVDQLQFSIQYHIFFKLIKASAEKVHFQQQKIFFIVIFIV